jgi:hypothetical protein
VSVRTLLRAKKLRRRSRIGWHSGIGGADASAVGVSVRDELGGSNRALRRGRDVRDRRKSGLSGTRLACDDGKPARGALRSGVTDRPGSDLDLALQDEWARKEPLSSMSRLGTDVDAAFKARRVGEKAGS